MTVATTEPFSCMVSTLPSIWQEITSFVAGVIVLSHKLTGPGVPGAKLQMR